MALAKMCKARAAVYKSVAEELAGKLQTLGCCEFTNKSDGVLEGVPAVVLRKKQRHIDELIAEAKHVIRVLEPFEVKQGGMFAPVPENTLKELAAKVDEEKFSAFFTELGIKEKELADCRTELTRLNGLNEQLNSVTGVEYPLSLFTAGTDELSGVIYSTQTEIADQFLEALKGELGDMFEFARANKSTNAKDTTVLVSVLCRKQDSDKVREAASKLSLTKIEVAKEFSFTVAEEKAKLTAAIEKCKEQEKAYLDGFTAQAAEGLEMSRTNFDYWTILHDRMASMESGDPTENVYIWSFWIPEMNFQDVEKVMKEYEEYVDFTRIDPDEGELAPTLLNNPSVSSPLESLTLMYGTPTYGSIDPTTLITPFFFVFFGMCFGDAGYGLILAGLIGFFMIRYKLPKGLRSFCYILFVGMICTIVYGVISGSFFGDSITAFGFLKPLAPIAQKFQVLDAMKDPITVLIISLVLGFIQILVGLAVAAAQAWKQGDKFGAIADQVSWIILLLGVAIFGVTAAGVAPAGLMLPSKILMIVGAGILVLTQGRSKKNIFSKAFSGVMSLYNITGYLSDVLSYSRLLALGLGSAAVGMVINLLCNLVTGIPYVGIVLAIVLFILGHTFSIAANLLGAFIHPLRLQYVEFFGKFYDANGVDFKPLNNATQYSKLV